MEKMLPLFDSMVGKAIVRQVDRGLRERIGAPKKFGAFLKS
jgi:hypothetical protein